MDSHRPVLEDAAARALAYATTIDERRVFPDATALDALAAFDEALSVAGQPIDATLRMLDEVGGPATVASTGPDYFGFVTGGTLPAALGASWLAAAWDQNAALPVMSPVAATLHGVVRRWLLDLLGLPGESAVAFVTGATVANASCLAAGRDALLATAGWDATEDGLFGAPPVTVVIGEQAHSTLRKSLGLVGLGRRRVVEVPADDQGRLRADLLPTDVPGPVLVCAQAGEVNTGAFDPFDAIADWVGERDGWLHVDAAFGLWACADPSRAHLVGGLDRADSWATDGHKWLNVTYDCGIAFVRRPADLARTFRAAAGYLPSGDQFEAMHHTPQSSQRARQIEVWAALRTLGRAGVERLVTDACDAAVVIAERLRSAGATIVNDVVLNQVLVRFDDAADHHGRARRGPGRRPGVVRADDLARRAGHAHQRVVVEDHARRCASRGRCDHRMP